MVENADEDAIWWLRLIRSRRVGPATFWRMLAEHGSAKAALAALPDVARAAGVQDYTPCPEGVVLAEMKAARAVGARLITGATADYPGALRDLPDAPPVIWVIGDVGLLARPMVAIVGARNASSLGTRMARRLATGLVEAGYVVVSGLARGIDGAAHEAAMLSGATVAVQAGGVDVIYPPENAGLAAQIAETGLRLSEQPPGTQPLARHFPLRNRLISGLARAVIVVEAAARSGSLITAKNALDQGREVLAVPGHPVDARAAGCNMLIRDGATLIRSPEDVLEVLQQASGQPQAALFEDPAPPPERTQARPAPRPNPPQRPGHETAALHQRILDRLGPSPLAEDQLIRDLALPAAAIAPQLLELELEGRIQRQAGGLLARLH